METNQYKGRISQVNGPIVQSCRMLARHARGREFKSPSVHKQNPLKPRYFTFSGNIIQFQSLVIRFEDIHIRSADRLRGKSAYLFWKVFMLDGKNTEEYDIVKVYEIPFGYKLEGQKDTFEKELWVKFWEYALDPERAKKMGIKNAQIEAPGTVFIPGMIYTIKIEHDGGMRIDTQKLPSIVRGENIPSDGSRFRVRLALEGMPDDAVYSITPCA